MPRKKNTPAKMVKVLEQGARDGRPRSPSIYSFIKSDPTSSPELIAYAWEKEARAALQIKDVTFAYFAGADGKPVRHEFPADYVDPSARALRLTFEKFNLDPDDPWSWQMMARYLSMIFFWKVPGKKGAPRKWTPELLMQLEQQAAPDLSNSEAAHRLANDKRSSFYMRGIDSRAGVEALRKRLNQVRRGKKAGTK